MNILITGGCGFIGSNLVRWLLSETDHTVLNLDALTYAGNALSLDDVANNPRYRFVRGDIGNPDQLRAIFSDFHPNAVMHLAAESHVDRSIDGPGVFIQTNIVGTFFMLQAARAYFDSLLPKERDVFRFLHVSTDEVFGSLDSNGHFTESTPYNPHSPYSASKAASDHLARAWSDTYGLPVVVTNCSNNYGPYQFPEKLIPVVILNALREASIPVYGRGQNVRDWLFVGDHVEALYAVLERGRPSETYNIGGNNELKNIDLVHILCGLLDRLRPRSNGKPYSKLISFVADRPGHDLRYAIDASKIRRDLGWVPKQDKSSGLLKTAAWYLENENWWRRILEGTYRLERLGANGRA